MFSDVRNFWFPRDVNKPRAYEDAYCLDSRSGLVAVADGVAGGVFSAPWANILTKATVEDPPDPAAADAFKEWLAKNRKDWKAGIDFSKLDYFQQRKLQEVGGGFSTLIWLDLRPVGEDDPRRETEAYRCLGCAVGDCCFFHVRDGQVLGTFPITESKQFDLTPSSIGSSNLNQDHHLQFELLDDYCRPGDLLVLATDAIACHLMKQLEQGAAIDWDGMLDMDEQQWAAWITELRAENAIRIDDTTLVLLPVAAPVTDGEANDDNDIDHSFLWSGHLFAADEEKHEVEPEPVASESAGEESAEEVGEDGVAVAKEVSAEDVMESPDTGELIDPDSINIQAEQTKSTTDEDAGSHDVNGHETPSSETIAGRDGMV